jgi:hypothetical protein
MRLRTAIARYAMSVASVAPEACLFFATAPASAESPELRHSIKIGVLNDRSGLRRRYGRFSETAGIFGLEYLAEHGNAARV